MKAKNRFHSTLGLITWLLSWTTILPADAQEYEPIYTFPPGIYHSDFHQQGPDGSLYGLASNTPPSGADQKYTIYKITSSGKYITIGTLISPSAIFAFGSDGTVYGTSSDGAYGKGRVCKITQKGVISTVVDFNGTNGAGPRGIVINSEGVLYGATAEGGTHNKGTIFKISPTGELTTLVHFTGPDGEFPAGNLLLAGDGTLYGITAGGGVPLPRPNRGTIFKVSPAGVLTTLFNEKGEVKLACDDTLYVNDHLKLLPTGELVPIAHYQEEADLLFPCDGSIYGIVGGWRIGDNISIYRVTPQNEKVTLVTFPDTVYAATPRPLVAGRDGNIYGITPSSDTPSNDIPKRLFKVTPTGGFSYLDFTGPAPRRLTNGRDGYIYGVSDRTVFRILVPPSNPDLVAVDDVIETPNPTSFTIDVLANDAPGKDGVTIIGTDNLLGGTAEIIESGKKIRFIAAAEFTGNGGFDYTISHPSSGTTTAHVTLRDTIAPVVDGTPPSFATINEDTPLPDFRENITITDAVRVSEVVQNISPGTILDRGTHIVTIEAKDAAGNKTSVGLIRVTVRPADLARTQLFATNTPVPTIGRGWSEIPGGSKWSAFGHPTINDSGKNAFLGTIKLGSGKTISGILTGYGAEPELRVKTGDPAPGTNGTFSSFKDPLLNNTNHLAIFAQISGTGVTRGNNSGIWTNAFRGVVDDMVLLVRTGDEPPGVPQAKWKQFISIALGDANQSVPAGRIAFVAAMANGPGGVTTKNDLGLWVYDSVSRTLALREGQMVVVDGEAKKVVDFTALQPLPTTAGHGNGLRTGQIACRVHFSDCTEAVVLCDRTGVRSVIASTGDQVPEGVAEFLRFGVPCISDSSDPEVPASIVFNSLLKKQPGKADRKNDGAIWTSNSDLSLRVIARKGEAAPGIDGANFATLYDPVGGQGGTAFLAKLNGPQVSTGNDYSLWWDTGDERKLIARKGSEAPGLPGRYFERFISLASPSGQSAGPVFVAALRAGRKHNLPNCGTGLWATLRNGTLQRIVHTGENVVVNGGTKTVRKFTALGFVNGSPSQTRSHNALGELIYVVHFTDGSQSIQHVNVP